MLARASVKVQSATNTDDVKVKSMMSMDVKVKPVAISDVKVESVASTNGEPAVEHGKTTVEKSCKT